MSTKGDLSRKRILEISRSLFAAKGFSGVTMQDICVASGMSRGGLYRHYASTAEVFAAIIRDEQAQAFDALKRATAAGVPPDTMLKTFLRSRMSQLLHPESCIDNAIPEFAANSPEGKKLLEERAASSIRIVGEMLRMGVDTGVYHCDACEATAAHIIWLLEGMGKHNALLPLTEEEVAAQIALIQRLLI